MPRQPVSGPPRRERRHSARSRQSGATMAQCPQNSEEEPGVSQMTVVGGVEGGVTEWRRQTGVGGASR